MRYARLPLDHAYLSALLSVCGRERNLRLGSSVHATIVKNAAIYGFNNCENHQHVIVIWNSLISMYSKCRELSDAAKVFNTMKVRDTVSWNSMISGCLMNMEFEMSFELLRQMQGSENCTSRFDHATLTTILSVCSDPKLLYVTTMMHSSVFLNGYGREISVGNALVTAYYKCGCSNAAQKVFDEMPERNVITWTAMVSGLSHSQSWKGSLILFREMRREINANSLTYTSTLQACSGMRALTEGRQIHGLVVKSGFHLNLCTESALMDMYSKCGVMEDACQIFESCEEPDEVTNTVILLGFAQNGMEERAFEFFVEMVGIGTSIDPNMISAVLGAFGVSAPFALGKQVHSLVIKKSFTSNLFVGNGLINMYSKCGNMTDAIKIFNQMVQRNAVSWNSIIAAFARHGQGSEALEFYERMKPEGMEPTDVTFLSLLHACSHVGSIEKGMEFLGSMSEVHGISPRIEHYACVVDMLGRAGRLDEAKSFIEQLPVEPNAHLWQALLGACGIYADVEMGMYAAQQLLLAEPECTAAYVVLANIYSSRKRWEERARVTEKMKEMGVKKEKGMSWIEVARDVRSFVEEDRSSAS